MSQTSDSLDFVNSQLFLFYYQMKYVYENTYTNYKTLDKCKLLLLLKIWKCQPMWFNWLEHCPMHQNVAGSIPGQHTCPGFGLYPQ